MGDQGEGGWSSSMPDRGGVRWSLDFGARRMGERVVVDVVGRIRLIWVCVWWWTGGWVSGWVELVLSGSTWLSQYSLP